MTVGGPFSCFDVGADEKVNILALSMSSCVGIGGGGGRISASEWVVVTVGGGTMRVTLLIIRYSRVTWITMDVTSSSEMSLERACKKCADIWFRKSEVRGSCVGYDDRKLSDWEMLFSRAGRVSIKAKLDCVNAWQELEHSLPSVRNGYWSLTKIHGRRRNIRLATLETILRRKLELSMPSMSRQQKAVDVRHSR